MEDQDQAPKSTLPAEILAKLPKQPLSSSINPLNGQQYSGKYYDILKKRIQWPVWEYKSSFMATLEKHQVTVLVGETKNFFIFYKLKLNFNVWDRRDW